MPARFDELFARFGRGTLTRHLGLRGVDARLEYRRPNGQPGGYFEAILSAERMEELTEGDGRLRKRVRDARIPRQAGLPFWDEPPSTEGSFFVGLVEYGIEAVEMLSESFASVTLVRIESVEHSRPGFRTKR